MSLEHLKELAKPSVEASNFVRRKALEDMRDAKEFPSDTSKIDLDGGGPCVGAPCRPCGGPPPKCAPSPQPPRPPKEH